MQSAQVCPEQLFRNPAQPFLRKPQTEQHSQKFPKNEKHLSSLKRTWVNREKNKQGGEAEGIVGSRGQLLVNVSRMRQFEAEGHNENDSALQGKLGQFTHGSCK